MALGPLTNVEKPELHSTHEVSLYPSLFPTPIVRTMPVFGFDSVSWPFQRPGHYRPMLPVVTEQAELKRRSGRGCYGPLRTIKPGL